MVTCCHGQHSRGSFVQAVRLYLFRMSLMLTCGWTAFMMIGGNMKC
jgi:hypothetical protein